MSKSNDIPVYKFQLSAKHNKIKRWIIHKCSQCNYESGFIIYDSNHVSYDSNRCFCNPNLPRYSTFKEIAEHYNRNKDNQDYISFWKLSEIEDPVLNKIENIQRISKHECKYCKCDEKFLITFQLPFTGTLYVLYKDSLGYTSSDEIKVSNTITIEILGEATNINIVPNIDEPLFENPTITITTSSI